MNKKGFTLIELLAVIVLIGITGILIVPNVVKFNNTSKSASYDMLVKNIKVAAENYFLECEFGSLEGCTITSNATIATLGTLANKGFLNVSDINNTGQKVVLDPRKTSNDLSGCKIIITKNVDNNGRVSYTVNGDSTNPSNCPYGE